MGTSFKLPFQLTARGSIATTTNPNEIARKRVDALIGTPPGERVMQPEYGVNLPAELFTPDIIESTDLISDEINTQVARWEPSITLLNITPITTRSEQGIAEVNVSFTLSNDPTFTPTLVATVKIGGKVVSN